MYSSDKFYSIGRLFGPAIGALTAIVTLLVVTVLIVQYFNSSVHQDSFKRRLIWTLSPSVGLIPFIVILFIPNKLEQETHTVNLIFISYGCDCANWRICKIDQVDVQSEEEDIYLESKTTTLDIPDSLRFNGNTFEVIGRFYKRKGFPRDYYSQEIPDKARVFQYSDFKKINQEHSGN